MAGRLPTILAVAGLTLVPTAAPLAAATSPQTVWEASLSMEGEPLTGSSIPIAVEVTANGDFEELVFELELPPAVSVEEDTRWELSLEAGESASRSWRVSIDERGFWQARLAETSNESLKDAACCLYVYSAPGEGQSGGEPEAAIPEPRAATETSFLALDSDTVEANYTVRRQAAWMRFGSFELRHSLGGEEVQSRAEYGDREAHHSFQLPLSQGEQKTVFVATHLVVGFQATDGGDEGYHAFVHCRNIQVERTTDGVEKTRDWGCETHRARGGQPTHPPGEGAQVGAPGALALAGALLAAAALARRRRGRR